MQSSKIRSMFAAGLLALASATASSQAVVLYDSGGFETSAGFTATSGPGSAGAFLAGQTGGSPVATWQQAPGGGAGNTPFAAVYPYVTPTSPNDQFVQVVAPNVPAANSNFFFPDNRIAAPFTPALNEEIAITWQMTILSGSNNPFFGIVAYSGDNVIARAGVNASTGALVGNGATVFPNFSASKDATFNYELLLNFTSKSYQVFTAAVGDAAFTLRGGGGFATLGLTNFTDADIAAFSLSTGPTPANYSGAANFDFYKVQTAIQPIIPEPASLGLGGVAFGLLTVRRRKTNAA